MNERSPITTHVLDLNRGSPAGGVSVTIERSSGPSEWKCLAKGITSSDGRVEALFPAGTKLEAGVYRLTFQTREYFTIQKIKSFYPFVAIVFEITASDEHYHVPLLLSAHGYSTYRGS